MDVTLDKEDRTPMSTCNYGESFLLTTTESTRDNWTSQNMQQLKREIVSILTVNDSKLTMGSHIFTYSDQLSHNFISALTGT